MTFNTHLTFRRAQKMIGSWSSLMRSVTFEAVTRTGIRVMSTTLMQICMTFETQVTLFALKERGAVAGMGDVTGRAVPLHHRSMAVSAFRLILHPGVTAQAQALLRRLQFQRSTLMTGSAFPLRYGGMHGCAPQSVFAPAVGIVTFRTSGCSDTPMR